MSYARIAGCMIALVAVGCTQLDSGSDVAAQDPRPGVLLAEYAGVLRCADCAAVLTRLRLFAEQPSALAVRYELAETYLGSRDGDRTFDVDGRWTVMRGTPADADATVYQLDFDRPGRARNFLRVGDDELRLLDRAQSGLPDGTPQSLRRTRGSVTTAPPASVLASDSGTTIDAERGQMIVVRLDSNRTTGYRWLVAATDSPIVTSLGDAMYVESATATGAVGAGGVEVWSFVVDRRGEQQLELEYRRPWEGATPAARTVTYTIRAVDSPRE